METYKTIEAAREAKGSVATYILEIKHKTAGRCFVGSRGNMAALNTILKSGQLPEIVSVIAQHSTKCEKETPKTILKCHRCGTEVTESDYSQMETAYLSGQSYVVKTYYCKHCHQLLSQVGFGEHSVLEDRQ